MYYSKLKVLHHTDKLNAMDKSIITAPIHIRIKPTNRCNHNCSYCSYQNSYGQLGKDMVKQDEIPEQKMIEILNDCKDMGVKAITFSGGGEPLVYKGINNAIAYASACGLKIGMLTNGVLLKEVSLKTVMTCCSWVRISMDGWDRASYKKYRGCPESHFDQLMSNLKQASKIQSDCVVGVNIIVDGDNATHLAELVGMVHDLGIRSIKISPCIVSNSARVNNEIHTALTPIVVDQLIRIEKSGIKVYDSYHTQLAGFKKDYKWCPYIQILPIIGADQNVYSCHDKAYNKDTGILGSIKDKSFLEFWFDGAEKFYKIDPSRDCNHHCVTDSTNKMLLEYFNTQHLEFV